MTKMFQFTENIKGFAHFENRDKALYQESFLHFIMTDKMRKALVSGLSGYNKANLVRILDTEASVCPESNNHGGIGCLVQLTKKGKLRDAPIPPLRSDEALKRNKALAFFGIKPGEKFEGRWIIEVECNGNEVPNILNIQVLEIFPSEFQRDVVKR